MILPLQEVKYLNNVTGIYSFCSALGFSKCRRYKRRYIKTSLVDEILASAIQPYGTTYKTLSSYNLVFKNLHVRTGLINSPLPYGSKHDFCRLDAEVCFYQYDVYGGV